MAEEFVTRETPELLSDTDGKQEALNRPLKLAWSAGRTGAYGRRVPEVKGGVRHHSCRAVCLCVRVQSGVFPVWKKREKR